MLAAALAAAVIAALLLVFIPVLFYLGLVCGVVYLVWRFTRAKCPSCGRHGTIGATGSQVVSAERGYGVVTRQDTTTTSKHDGTGSMVTETSTTSRQERAPVVRKTVRTTYRCKGCGYNYTRDSVSEEEDFSDRPQKEKETTIIQREVVKVPCKYCGALNDISTQRTCSNCGAVVKS